MRTPSRWPLRHERDREDEHRRRGQRRVPAVAARRAPRSGENGAIELRRRLCRAELAVALRDLRVAFVSHR